MSCLLVDCLAEETVLRFASGRLPAADLVAVENHVRTCTTCEQLLAAALRAASCPRSSPGVAHANDRQAPVGALASGTAVGRYTVLSLVGRGGMGEVYAAYDPKLDRKVALKLLRSRGSDRDGRAEARLLREAQAIARLSHPNVITVFDIGAVEDRVYVAMEFIEGHTLASWLAARPRTRGEILSVFTDAARGLSAVHAGGLVHRDFKPQNVMVGLDGTARVTDFGLVRRLNDTDSSQESEAAPAANAQGAVDATLTRTGEMLGTPLYMSPEQFDGRPTEARSDSSAFALRSIRLFMASIPSTTAAERAS